jgi:hypothetical protein
MSLGVRVGICNALIFRAFRCNDALLLRTLRGFVPSSVREQAGSGTPKAAY